MSRDSTSRWRLHTHPVVDFGLIDQQTVLLFFCDPQASSCVLRDAYLFKTVFAVAIFRYYIDAFTEGNEDIIQHARLVALVRLI